MHLSPVNPVNLETIKKTHRMSKAKLFHRWVGLILAPFMVLFALSGIILNHKDTFDKIPISRRLLPTHYRFRHWNNQLVAGSIPIASDSLLLYSKNGAFLSDSMAHRVARIEEGLPNRLNRINDAIKLPNGAIIGALPEGLFTLRNARWHALCSANEPIVSLTARGDTLIAVSRSALYVAPPPYTSPQRILLPPCPGNDGKVPLFRIVWNLHSGALFWLPGRLFVDLLGIILIALTVAGVGITISRTVLRRRSRRHRNLARWRTRLRRNYKYHLHIGRLVALFLLLAITGTCLRPPLLIPLALTRVSPPRITSLHSSNPWHDKIRKIAFDPAANDFILSTSEGFFCFANALRPSPQKIAAAPPVSVMGCNVLQYADSAWLVGSFSGFYRWHRPSGSIVDAITGEPYVKRSGMPTFGGLAAAGYSGDFPCGPVVFDYVKGAIPLKPNAAPPAMPSWLQLEPISLWNAALEVHTGRIFDKLLGPVAPFFIFIMGSFAIALLATGWRRLRRAKKQRR